VYEIYTQYASIYYLLDYLNFLWLLLKFLAKSDSCFKSGGSITSAHKGVAEGGQGVILQNGERIPETKLYTGSLVAEKTTQEIFT